MSFYFLHAHKKHAENYNFILFFTQKKTQKTLLHLTYYVSSVKNSHQFKFQEINFLFVN